jgi:NADP-dependent 3-hydroxy acid dehydrogenase YdfG
MTAIDTDVEAVERMFDVNVFGPMRMVHHFHDMIIRAQGTIVNLGSVGGIMPYLYGCTLFFTHLQSLASRKLSTTTTVRDSFLQRHQSSTSALV